MKHFRSRRHARPVPPIVVPIGDEFVAAIVAAMGDCMQDPVPRRAAAMLAEAARAFFREDSRMTAVAFTAAADACFKVLEAYSGQPQQFLGPEMWEKMRADAIERLKPRDPGQSVH